jgi:diguanylate cyclase (GGDEF)-like protein
LHAKLAISLSLDTQQPNANFKSLNDLHGHEVGDQVLLQAAERIRKCVREMDTVARFGGDEFVVLLGELSNDLAESRSHAAIVAEKIRSVLLDQYTLTLQVNCEPVLKGLFA